MRQNPTQKVVFTSFILLPITPNQQQLRVSFLEYIFLVGFATTENYHSYRFSGQSIAQELDLCGKTRCKK